MADIGTKISELEAAAALDGTELLVAVQGGQTKKSTAAAVETLVKTGLTAADVGLGNVANERQYSANNPPPTPTPAEIGAVPVTRTINGKALSTDITLDASDVGAEGSLTWDNAPTAGSANPVKSGGIYDALLKLYPTDSASGAVASFPDGGDGVPVVDIKVSIEPVQEGSGDPGPGNIRPISGWNGAVVKRVGKNLYPPYTEPYTNNDVTLTPNGDGSFTLTGSASSSNFTAAKLLPFPIDKEAPFSFSLNNDVVNSEVGVRAINPPSYGTLITANEVGRVREGMTISSYAPNRAQVVVVSNHGAVAAIKLKPQLELGASATEWAAYTEESAAVSWADVAGSVYGGELDLTAGTLTVTHGYIASYAGEALPGEWISDRDVYAEGTSPSTGAQVVYELAAPVTYAVQAAALRTVLGVNHVFADCGDVAVEYRADVVLYIDKKIAELQALILENG